VAKNYSICRIKLLEQIGEFKDSGIEEFKTGCIPYLIPQSLNSQFLNSGLSGLGIASGKYKVDIGNRGSL